MGGTPRGGSGPLGANNNVTNTLPARVNAQASSTAIGPTGRHFKPFDHRRMNPMAEIQEDPYAAPAAPSQVQKSTHQIPHMPSEVRHTNYSQRKVVNPHIMEHRDSANFSMASSDSG